MLGKPIEKVFMFDEQCLAAIAVIRLESKPPERRIPTGTSAVINRFLTAAISNLSISLSMSASLIDLSKVIFLNE